jgi:hypothetical protein
MLWRFTTALFLAMFSLSARSIGERPSTESRITCNVSGEANEVISINLDAASGGNFQVSEGSHLSVFNGAFQGAAIEVASDNSVSDFFMRKELSDGRFISLGIDPFAPSQNGEFVAVIYHQPDARSSHAATGSRYLPSRRVNCRMSAQDLTARVPASLSR